MMATMLALVAAFTGPPDDAPFPSISDVEVVESADSTSLFAYDHEREVAAEIVVSINDGKIKLDALFPDGLYLSVVTDGDAVNIDTDDAEEAAARLGKIDAFLQETEPQKGEVPCAAALVAGAVHAAAASPWVIVEAILAACECLPLLVDEWEDYHCPGFG